jgi:hypothetical protein
MGMVRFKLDGISAFRNKSHHPHGAHYCVQCARTAMNNETLIPFLDGQLSATLSSFGKDMAAMVSCDNCGEVLATYYPENFWTEKNNSLDCSRNPLLFKKF